jgi:hypothetical protein
VYDYVHHVDGVDAVYDVDDVNAAFVEYQSIGLLDL